MRAPAWNELLPLPEDFAVQRYLDGLNLQALRWLAAVTTVGAVVPLILLLSSSMWPGAAAMVAVLAANLSLLLLRERPIFRRHVSLFLFAHAMLVLLALAIAAPEPMAVWAVATLLLAPGFLFALRWRESLLWTLGGALLATAVWSAVTEGAPEPFLPLVVFATVWIAAVALAGRRVTRRRLASFRDEYRRQSSMERERSRMRDELDDARAVQLSMLPRSPPELPWIEVASVSVPATEVGGDYYDYLVIDEDRIALVVGDVSGHGMASGLVLAAVRGGLHLLRDELDRPVRVLERLDGMLRATTPGRMFVTLQLAVVDRRRRQIVVANAGHPPLLHLSARGVQAVGSPGTPLGTRLAGEFGEQSAVFEPGDVLVLYTDGATEARNFRGEPYGADRLEREVLRRGADHGVRALRDELLGAFTHFRSDGEQEDDVTLIVVGLEPGGGA